MRSFVGIGVINERLTVAGLGPGELEIIEILRNFERLRAEAWREADGGRTRKCQCVQEFQVATRTVGRTKKKPQNSVHNCQLQMVLARVCVGLQMEVFGMEYICRKRS